MINTEIKKNTQNKYPCLKISSCNDIVLFINENTGCCLKSKEYPVGHWSTVWCENEEFKYFNDKLILNNLEN